MFTGTYKSIRKKVIYFGAKFADQDNLWSPQDSCFLSSFGKSRKRKRNPLKRELQYNYIQCVTR